MDPTQQHGDEIEALKALSAAQGRLLEEQGETISRLLHQIELLKKLIYGKKNEKRAPADTAALQQSLFAEELAAEAARLAEQNGQHVRIEVAAHVRVKKGRRSEFPSHLPVVRSISELGADDRTCACGGELREFGEEVSRELERIETSIIHELVRKKYACESCHEGVVTPAWRGKVIDKGLLGPGFLAHVITERFGNHLPYYRLEGKYRTEGLELSRSVLCESMARCAELLEPIADVLKQEILASPIINTDDTPVRVAQPKVGPPHDGRVWVYLDQHGRHWYEFTDSRKRDGPARVFADFTGYIQADAYGGYDRLFLPGGATEVGCWSHGRRGFIDAESTEPLLAAEAIAQIRELFAIEQAAAGLTTAARLALRQQRSVPLLEELKIWLSVTRAKVLPKSPLAQAIGYLQNQWEALMRYTTDGRLEMTNNAAERALKPFAIGRKNWMFFQREGGGRTAATLMSLLMSAKAIGLNPLDYFRDVLLRIAEPGLKAADLTPHRWKERYAAEVAARRFEILQKLVAAA